MGQLNAGGAGALKDSPLISMIACSLTTRAYKHMDLEVNLQCAQAGVPIQACSLPGAGGTSPATMAGTALLVVVEIMATVVSPLQLIVDDEVLGMAGSLMAGFELTEEELAWEVLTQTDPGQHFLTSPHTVQHCRDGHKPGSSVRDARESWVSSGGQSLMERLKEKYKELMARDNPDQASVELTEGLDALVAEADRELIH